MLVLRENRWLRAAQGTQEKGGEGRDSCPGLQLTPQGATGIWVGGRGYTPPVLSVFPTETTAQDPNVPSQ